ncbi:MAG: ABC transporter ATP-binding protein [Candidatus Latescibacterota bacterium]
MPKIEFRHVRKSFDDNHVLRDVNLDVQSGETLAVIGRSGSGKSVILKHMVGLVKPDSGQVFVDGEDITPLHERDLFRVRRKFGFLFQSAALLDSLTVGENVGLALKELDSRPPKETRKIVAEKLALVGLGGTESLMPVELSGGMRKRAGLARAIALEPVIILYDEPTTGLDPVTADTINELILRLQDRLSVTSVVVTHDMASIRKVADRVSMLHEGIIVFTGTVAELDSSDNPIVRQFVEGRAEGPIQQAPPSPS